MVGSSTKSSETSMSSFTPWAARTLRANSANRPMSTARSDCSSAAKTSAAIGVAPAPGPHVGGLLIGGDDVGHDAGPDHVALGQIDELHLGNLSEDVLETGQAGAASGDIDLGDVAGDHHLGTEADPGEEHLHLLWCRVLSLIEDDETAVEGTAPHEGQGSHLDGSPLEQTLGSLRSEEVVEGVVQRTQIGIDFGHDVAGEEAETLTSLHRRSGEDDPLDLAGLKRLHPQGDGQVRLACAGRSDTEGHDIVG